VSTTKVQLMSIKRSPVDAGPGRKPARTAADRRRIAKMIAVDLALIAPFAVAAIMIALFF